MLLSTKTVGRIQQMSQVWDETVVCQKQWYYTAGKGPQRVQAVLFSEQVLGENTLTSLSKCLYWFLKHSEVWIFDQIQQTSAFSLLSSFEENKDLSVTKVSNTRIGFRLALKLKNTRSHAKLDLWQTQCWLWIWIHGTMATFNKNTA